MGIQYQDIFTSTDVGKMKEHVSYLLQLLPKQTLDRKHIDTILIEKTHWFRRGVTYSNMLDTNLFPQGPLTGDIAQAASHFSLPWGMTNMKDNNPYANIITMYLPIETYPIHVVDIYLAYVFFHEIGHIYSNAAYFSLYYAKKFLGIEELADKRNSYTLTLPNGNQVSGNEYVEGFASLAVQYGPFGSYTAGYSKDNDEDLWLRESFADATAAYFMGFMMYPEKNFAPLYPEVQRYIHDFYHAVASIER